MSVSSQRPRDPDEHKGAVEGDRPSDPQHSNRNANRHAATLTRDGGPPPQSAPVAQDRVGANVDDPEVSQAAETGRTADEPAEEDELG
jgi:hypothetical protein